MTVLCLNEIKSSRHGLIHTDAPESTMSGIVLVAALYARGELMQCTKQRAVSIGWTDLRVINKVCNEDIGRVTADRADAHICAKYVHQGTRSMQLNAIRRYSK